LNSISVIGYLGNSPEMKYLESGTAVTEFSVADNYKRTTPEGKEIDTVTWFRIHAFGRLAEIADEYLEKGRQVYVQGRLETTAYETRDGKNLGVSNDVYASQIVFLGAAEGREDGRGKPERNQGRQQRTSRARNNPARADGDSAA